MDEATEVGQWVREELGLEGDAEVAVEQVTCSDEGCSPFETVIFVAPAGEEPFEMKIHKPVAEVERMDVVTVLAFGEH